ncbi:MAG: hypothetical protein MK312_08090 [Roseibacillus sp.]|nr:hypothetical protein [Roseibacillus sp.]
METGYYSGRIEFKWIREQFANATGYLIEHLDGFRTTMLLVNIRDFTTPDCGPTTMKSFPP